MTDTKGAPAPATPDVWGRAYRRALNAGYDHGWAAYVADRAERRAARKERS